MSAANLVDVELNAERAASARSALKAAVVRAHDAGETIKAIAAAAGVGRQTIYRWLGEESGEFVGRPIDALRAALRILAGAIDDPHAADNVRRRINGSEVSVAVAYRIASDAIGRQTSQERPDDETRTALAAGAAALERLEKTR